MAVKVNGNRGLNFVGTFDISHIEEQTKKALATFAELQKQAGKGLGKMQADDSYRKEQIAIQKALGDSRLALQKLKEEQALQRAEQEKSKSVIAAERAEKEKLKAVEAELSLQYKQGKLAIQEYTQEQRKIADAQRESTRIQREAERTLKEQVKLQKEQEKQAERNRKQLEKESSEYYKLTTALGKVRTEAKNVQAEMFRLEREGKNTSDAYRLLEIRSKALTAETKILDRGVKQIDASLGLHQRNVGNYGSALASINPIIGSVDQKLGLLGTSLDGLITTKDPFKNLGASLMAFGRATVAFMLTPVGAIITALAAMYALISSNKKTVVEFDAGLRGVQKTTGMAEAELYKFGDSIIALSNNLKSVSSKQLLEYAQVAGQLGVKGSANILRFAETLARLETASNIAGEEGASDIARLLTLTDGGVQNVQAFGDEIVNLGNNFAATEKEILSNATRIAQNTGLYKIGRQEVLAYATATKAVGVEAELVGSTFGRTLGVIEKSLRTGNGAQTFAALTGKTVADLQKAFKSDASGVFNEFIAGLNKVNAAGGSVNAVLEQAGITAIRDQSVIASLATNGYDVLNDSLKAVKDSGGSLGDEFDTANKKLENVGKRIGIAWDNLVLSIENGQGVFAKVGSYIGNEFANTLVATKNLVDEVGVAWNVFAQYFSNHKAQMEEGVQPVMQYADALSGLKDLLGDISIRSFLYTFAVEIPNAFRMGMAQVEAFKNVIVGLLKFLLLASKDIGIMFRDALNPFARGTSAFNIKELYNTVTDITKATNDAILKEAEKANAKYIELFNKRYDDAKKVVEAGEQDLVDAANKGVNGALAAAIEAEAAAAEAIKAGQNNKFKAANEAAKRAEEAAKRAAEEAKLATADAKAAADEAAQRAADAATKARQAADAAMENVKSRQSLQAKIDEINKAAHRKELSQNEAEIQAIRDKFQKIREEIAKFNRDPRNAGLRVNTSGLKASEQKEVDNATAKQEVEAMKVSLGEQKVLYDAFQQYMQEYGEQKARERFAGEISEFENYVAYLKSLIPDSSDNSIKAIRMREMLEKELQKAEKTAADKAFDENLKNFNRVIGLTQDSVTERLRIEAQYQKDLQTLEQNLGNEADAAERERRKRVLDDRKAQELQALQERAFQESAFYKKVMQDVTFMTRDQIKAQVKEIKRILKDPSLSPVERATAKGALSNVQGYLDETNKVAEDAREVQEYAQAAANSFGAMSQALAGMSPGLSDVLSKMSQLANIGGQAAGAVASFAAGDIPGAITQSVGAIAGIISMLDNSQERQQRAEEQRQYAQSLQIKSMEAMTKALERQLAAIEDIYGVERLQAYGKAIDDINSKIKEQTESLKNRYVLTGNKSADELLAKLNDGTLSKSTQKTLRAYLDALKASTYTLDDLLAGVASGSAESIEELQQLLDKGLLDEQTAAIVEDLLGNMDRVKEAMQQMREEATGLSFDSATDSLMALFEQGKTGVEDFGKFFDDTIRKSILNAFKRNVLEKAMAPFYDLLYEASKDGDLTAAEIADLDKLGTEIGDSVRAQFESYKQLMDGLGTVEADAGQPDTLSGAIRSQLTEETGGKIAGIMQGQFGLMKQQLVIQEGILSSSAGCYEVAKQSLFYQEQTAYNTRQNAESSIRIESTLSDMKTSLSKMANSSSSSARDLGYDG